LGCSNSLLAWCGQHTLARSLPPGPKITRPEGERDESAAVSLSLSAGASGGGERLSTFPASECRRRPHTTTLQPFLSPNDERAAARTHTHRPLATDEFARKHQGEFWISLKPRQQQMGLKKHVFSKMVVQIEFASLNGNGTLDFEILSSIVGVWRWKIMRAFFLWQQDLTLIFPY
jgi:hypothetical protein